jgi:lipopolysaccharide transport system permease protein
MSSTALQETVYTPASELRRPSALLSSMWRDLFAARELAWRLFVRNISAQYRQSILGYLWAFLPPIVTTMTFVFLSSQSILNVDKTSIPYPAYVMLGSLLWQVFLDSTNNPLKQTIAAKSMLAKINFPREALVLSGLYEVLFNFAIRLLLLVGVFIWYKIQVSWTLLLTPIGLIGLIALGTAIGMFLSPLGMLYEDVGRGLTIITSLWFFVTPVVYPPPKHWPFSLLSQLNPVSPLLVSTRDWLTGLPGTGLESLVIVGVLSLVMLLTSWLLYRLAMPYLIERMSA